nr:protein kinase [Deltaproteobacteria bacterium]
MHGCLDDIELAELVAGSADARTADIEAHLAGCSSCRETVAILIEGQRVDSSASDPGDVSAPQLEVPGAHVGRYEIAETLGAGGMGVVYAAHDPKLDRKIALRVVRNAGPSADLRLREAQAMARLAHPNVVTVHDVIAHEAELVIAMELVPGTTLARWLTGHKRGWAEIVEAFVQAGRGLAAAHEAGLVHRDFKPSNVFVRDDGRVQVGDFGVATEAPPEATTPRYMAPEQQTGQADERSDQYSFAIALRDSLGERSLPAELPRIIARASAKDPAARYSSIAAVIGALEAMRAKALPSRAARRAVPAIAGVALATTLGFVIATRADPEEPVISREVTVAMLPFADHTRDTQLDFTTVGLPRLLGSELQRAGVRVIGTYELRDRTPEPPPSDDVTAWRERAVELGAGYTISGVLESAGDRVGVAITLARGDGIPLGSWVSTGAPTTIPNLVAARAEQLVAAIGGAAAKPKAPYELEVERDLTRGIEAFQLLNNADARTWLEAVIRKQPAHADARYYLALITWWDHAPQPDLEAACRAALQTELTLEQAGVITGVLALAGNDFDAAIEHFRRLEEQYPTSAHVQYALSEALLHGGYPAEGITVYRQLVELVPRWHRALVQPLTYYMVHRDEAGLQWAFARLPLLDQISATTWQYRRQIMRGELRSTLDAILKVRAEARAKGQPLLYEQEMVMLAVVLDDNAALATQDPVGNPWHANALALWRGDRSAAGRGVDVVLGQVGSDRRFRYDLAHAIPLVAVANDRDLAERTLKVLDRAIGSGRPAVSEQLGRAFLYAILERRGDLHALTSSAMPEVATVARALELGLDGKPAPQVWKRAFELSADGRFVSPGRVHAARVAATTGDHAGVLAHCDAILRPHVLDLSIAPAIPQCREWVRAATK